MKDKLILILGIIGMAILIVAIAMAVLSGLEMVAIVIEQ